MRLAGPRSDSPYVYSTKCTLQYIAKKQRQIVHRGTVLLSELPSFLLSVGAQVQTALYSRWLGNVQNELAKLQHCSFFSKTMSLSGLFWYSTHSTVWLQRLARPPLSGLFVERSGRESDGQTKSRQLRGANACNTVYSSAMSITHIRRHRACCPIIDTCPAYSIHG